MVKPPLTLDEEVAGIERALDTLLRAAIEADQNQPRRKISIADAMMTYADLEAWMDRPKAARDAEQIMDNPVGFACRKSIRLLGNRLFDLGGCELMGDVCQRVADMDPAKWGYRTDIMDKRWDGIGLTDNGAGWVA